MALNVAVFRTRTLTSIVFVIIMLAGLLINQWGFLLLFTIIHFGCWHEYQKLTGKIHPEYANINPLHKYAIMITGWGFMLLMTSGAYDKGYINLVRAGTRLIYIMPLIVILSEIFFSRGKFVFKRLGLSLLGLVYISLPMGLIILIYSQGLNYETAFGYIPIIILIASIWVNDTMAYLAGSLIGKTPLSKVSPKKTWEGTIVGGLLAVVTVTILSKVILGTDYFVIFFLSLIAVIAGAVGDLFESWLKRKADVKDSGKIMPGHGGFLDRFDSLLFATTFVWVYIYIFKLIVNSQ